MSVIPAELVADCLAGGVRRLIGGVHSLTSSRVVVVCVDPQWVRVRFSTPPGPLPGPWEDDGGGWVRAPRGSEPGLRDASADPVLVVVGVAATHLVAVNVLAIDEIAVTCAGRDALIGNWALQAQVQGAAADQVSVAGAVLSDNPDATVVVADPITGMGGWVDVLAAGTAWPVRPLTAPTAQNDPTAGPAQPGEPAQAAADPASVDPTTDDPVPAAPEDTPPTPEPGDRTEDGPADSVAAQSDSGSGRMRVFGGFEVVDAAGAALQPMQQDLVGGIAFNPSVSTQDLCQLLFGSPDKPPSFHVAMSKMRRRGINPELVDGGYRLDNIDSEWAHFTALAGPDPAQTDTAALAAAADLITGPIFGARPPRWARPLLEPMRAHTAAVCRELAARHSEQPAEALRYAQIGLSVDPTNPDLTDIVDMLDAQRQEA